MVGLGRDGDAGVPVGARIRDGALVVGSVFHDADVVGRVLPRDTLSIPLPGECRASPDAFRLGVTRPSHLVLHRAAIDALRRADASLRRRIPAMLGALCIPFSFVPTQALASTSGSRRSRGDERDVEEPEVAPREKPILHDIVWETLTGEMITVSRGDLPAASGKLVEFDDHAIVLAVPNGSLLTIQREEITSVRRHVPPPAPRDAVVPTTTPTAEEDEDEDDPAYKAHVITGSIIVGLGGTVALAGLVAVAATAPGPQCGTAEPSSSSLCGDGLGSYPWYWAATVVAPGLVIVASGAAVLGVGMKRKKQNEERRAKAQVSVTPRVQRDAWGGNLQLRF